MGVKVSNKMGGGQELGNLSRLILADLFGCLVPMLCAWNLLMFSQGRITTVNAEGTRSDCCKVSLKLLVIMDSL